MADVGARTGVLYRALVLAAGDIPPADRGPEIRDALNDPSLVREVTELSDAYNSAKAIARAMAFRSGLLGVSMVCQTLPGEGTRFMVTVPAGSADLEEEIANALAPAISMMIGDYVKSYALLSGTISQLLPAVSTMLRAELASRGVEVNPGDQLDVILKAADDGLGGLAEIFNLAGGADGGE